MPSSFYEYRGLRIYVIGRRLAGVLLSSADRNMNGRYAPQGLFIIPCDDGTCSAIDNSRGDAWTEDFHNIASAKKWLAGEYDHDEYIRRNRRRPEFIAIFGPNRETSGNGAAVPVYCESGFSSGIGISSEVSE